ncbi:MAG: hypothetical protein FD169_632 [Bacillota bacterium]|nr:MAG: hypothetical protein FD169_632 [Bacillota bacterium]
MERAVPLSSVRGVLLKAGFVETKTSSGTHLVFQDPDSQSFITLPNTAELKPMYVRAVVKTLVDNGLATETQAKLALRSYKRKHLASLTCKSLYTPRHMRVYRALRVREY